MADNNDHETIMTDLDSTFCRIDSSNAGELHKHKIEQEEITVEILPRKRIREERNLEEEIHSIRYASGLTRFPTLREEIAFRQASNPSNAFPIPFEYREINTGEAALFISVDTKSADANYIRHNFHIVSHMVNEYHRQHPKSLNRTLLQLVKLLLTLTERHQVLCFHERALPIGENWKPIAFIVEKSWRKLM